MTVFYPSAKVRLYVRLEDFGTEVLSATVPAARALDRGAADIASSLRRRTPADAGNAVVRRGDRWCIVAAGEASGGPPGEPVSEDKLTVLADVRPLKLTVDLNGIRAADTFGATFDVRDVPFDPRAIRSIGVEAYFGTITADAFAAAMRPDAEQQLVPPGLVPDVDPVRLVSNLRLMGWADHASLTVPEDEPATLELEGRDNTSLLLDADLPPGLTLDDTVLLDEAVAKLLATLPAARGFYVMARGGATMPRAASLRPEHAKSRDGSSKRPAQAEKVSYWDYVLDAVQSLGFVAYVDVVEDESGQMRPTVVLQEPRTLVGIGAVRDDDPFSPGRTVLTAAGHPEELQVRRLVHGRNVRELVIERKLGRIRANGVEVRAFDPETKRTIIARYPEAQNLPRNVASGRERPTHVLAGDAGADSRYTVHVVRDVVDRATLERRARAIYDQVARQEVAIKVSTDDLASFGGGNEDPDLLDLKSGDPLEVVFARRDPTPRAPTEDAMADLETQDEAERAAYLRGLGYPQEAADAIASKVRPGDLFPIFRVRNVRFTFDGAADSPSVGVELDCTNFLVVREDAEEAAG